MSARENPRLFELAAANSQRAALRDFVAVAPPRLRAYVESSESLVHPRTPLPLIEALSSANQVHAGTKPPSGYETFETSSLEVINAWLSSRLGLLPESAYYVTFGQAGQYTFSSQSCWVPKLPVLQSSKAALQAVFSEVLDLAEGHLGVVQQDGKASLVLDCYVGALPNAPSPNEVVYELTFHRSDG